MSIEQVNHDHEFVDSISAETSRSFADQQMPEIIKPEIKSAPILCPHCQRTATNGLKCKGICVAESDY
jgi:hypothetical protein